jgi:hypothetical protein
LELFQKKTDLESQDKLMLKHAKGAYDQEANKQGGSQKGMYEQRQMNWRSYNRFSFLVITT